MLGLNCLPDPFQEAERHMKVLGYSISFMDIALVPTSPTRSHAQFSSPAKDTATV